MARLPEAERVDVEAWDGEPTFRVKGKVFVFSDPDGTGISVKLPREEAAAVTATDGHVREMGYGLGRHGWVSVTIPEVTSDERWQEIEEWIRTSYTLIGPKRLSRQVLEQDAQPPSVPER